MRARVRIVKGVTHFDAASAEPPHPAARAALLAAFDEGWADPARLYRAGRQARMLLDQSRAAVAEVLGCRAREVLFTPSGTAAIHYGVAGVLAGRRRVGERLVVSAVEHSAVLHAAEVHVAQVQASSELDEGPAASADGEPTITEVLSASGVVTVVGVDRLGRVDVEAFARELRVPGTALACLQAANHEVGTVQPLAPVFEAAAEAGVPLLVDAAQVVGRMPVPRRVVRAVCFVSQMGRARRGRHPRVRKGTRFAPTWAVDEHEDGRVPGRGEPAGHRRRRRGAGGPGAGARGGGGAAAGADRAAAARPCRRSPTTSRSSATRTTGCRTWSRSPARR